MKVPFLEFSNPDIVEYHVTPLVRGLREIDVNRKEYEDTQKTGKGVDGSSIWLVENNQSDQLLKPIPGSYRVLPWDRSIAMVLCDVYNYADAASDIGKETEFEGSPRTILKKVVAEADRRGYTYKTAVEIEFFLLNKNLTPLDNVGYFSPVPNDQGARIRREIARTLAKEGIEWTYGHHEVAKACQQEISFAVQNALQTCDNIAIARYYGANIAWKYQTIFTVMPKPFPSMNGSGMHLHMSLCDNRTRKNIFQDSNDSEMISPLAKQFLAGMLDHIKGLSGLVANSINSYKRLVPNFEAPTTKSWGPKNRTVPIRRPGISNYPSTRIEFRTPDGCSNQYLDFAAILYAGLDGIDRKLELQEPLIDNAWNPEVQKSKNLESLPGNLRDALIELEKDSVLMDGLGRKAMEKYLEEERKEIGEFEKDRNDFNPLEITPWEYERYLRFV